MYEKTKHCSMVHVSGYYSTYRSMRYLAENGIRGALVECGCFLGGMTAFMALARRHFGLDCPIIAFDTFCGFPEGSTDSMFGIPAGASRFERYREAVERNIQGACGSLDGITLVEGPVEETIPRTPIDVIALLRLDTDHYDSTIVEISHYYPRLVPNGALIVDDYGCYDGARRATDEYFARLPLRPMLHRIDGGVFAGIKPASDQRCHASDADAERERAGLGLELQSLEASFKEREQRIKRRIAEIDARRDPLARTPPPDHPASNPSPHGDGASRQGQTATAPG